MRFSILRRRCGRREFSRAPAFAADLGNAEPLPAPPSSRPRRPTTGPASISACSAATAGARPTPTRSATSMPTASTSAAMPAPTGSGAISWSARKATSSFRSATARAAASNADQGLNGSLRGRAGIALDRFLLYGTGGVARNRARAELRPRQRRAHALGLDGRRRRRRPWSPTTSRRASSTASPTTATRLSISAAPTVEQRFRPRIPFAAASASSSEPYEPSSERQRKPGRVPGLFVCSDESVGAQLAAAASPRSSAPCAAKSSSQATRRGCVARHVPSKRRSR